MVTPNPEPWMRRMLTPKEAEAAAKVAEQRRLLDLL
jgi:hypothetical protein